MRWLWRTMVDTCARDARLRANVRGGCAAQIVKQGIKVALRGRLSDLAVRGRGGCMRLVLLGLRELEKLSGRRGRGTAREDVISVGNGIHASDRSVQRAQALMCVEEGGGRGR